MHPHRRHLAAFSVLVSALVVSAPAAAQGADLVLKIGHVAPLTGNQAHLGKDNEIAAKMAVADLNKAGIQLGGKKVRFELISEDDGADPKQGTAAAQKLVDAKVVGVIGHLNSGTTIPASAIYHKAGIPQISPSATNPKYTQQGFDGAFRVVANDQRLGGVLGRYAATELKGQRVAVIDDRTAYGQGVADEFVKGLKSAGVEVVARQYTNDRATDFSGILTAIRGKKPDVVFYGGMDAVAGPMIRQMRQQGIDATVVGGDGVCTGDLPKLAGPALGDRKLFCAEAGGVTGAYVAKDKAFRERFRKETGQEVKLYAPYVYDATMMLAEAIQKAQSADPKKVIAALKGLKYEGVTGPIAFDAKGDVLSGTLTLFTYEKGSRSLVRVIQ